MRPFSFRTFVVVLIVSGFGSSFVFAQGSLNRTTFGKSQNSSEDLANSLAPAPAKVGKGEKKQEIDPKTLQSKKTTDTTFSGGLNDIGVDWSGDKMGKPHAATDADSKQAKQSEAGAKKDSNSPKSTEPSENAQSNERKQAPVSDDKSPAKEKASASKPEGDR